MIVQKSVRDVRDAVQVPGLLNVIVSENPVTLVTQVMVGKTEDKDWIVVSYYANVPKPYYKTTANEQERDLNGAAGH